jgi:glycosyltransferase involved in cell wall biosynthesis
MTRVAYIVSFVTKSVAFEWIAESIDGSRFELVFILLNPEDSLFEQHLRDHKVRTHRVQYAGKKDIPRSLLEVHRLLRKERIDIVHTHLFEGSLVGLAAAKLAGIKRRIHTRHNATIHHNYHPRAVKYDRMINHLSTEIVAISENVRSILVDLEKVNPHKITLIHHGFKLAAFKDIPENRVEALRGKYLSAGPLGPVFGVISRYIHWKGVQYIVPAFRQVLSVHRGAKLLLANTNGPYSLEIKSLLKQLPEESYVEIPFEADIFALYQLFDVFVHVPIDPNSEAFGQIYVEALAAGIPSIVTLSGIACEFIQDGETALTVPFRDSDAIRDALLRLVDDQELQKTLSENGKTAVAEMFTLERMVASLESMYAK